MSICKDVVAMKAHDKKVMADPVSESFLFGLLKFDNPPKRSNVVKADHQKNRSQVKSGVITSWGEHGRVAIVTDENGISAAFFNHELDFPRACEDDGSIASLLVHTLKD